MNPVRTLVDKFGTQSAFAAMLDVHNSNVAYWIKKETIPSRWHGLILEKASERGIDVTPEDLLFVEKKPRPSMLGVENVNTARIPMAKWFGRLDIGDQDVPCYVLDNGERVISRTGAFESLTGKAGNNLEAYLGVSALARYIPENLSDSLIEFRIESVSHVTTKGMPATVFLGICKAYVDAYRDGALTSSVQQQIAIRCMMFLASCAKVGFLALIDEATGYQYARAEDALQVKLKAFLAEEMRKWEKTFPDELWKELGRLTNWKGTIQQRPKYWGKIVMELIYDYLDKDVAEWLKKNAPKPRTGQNYHQWMSDQYGLQKLIQHIWMVIGMARTCNTVTELKEKMAVSFGRKPVQFTLYLPPPEATEKTSA
jgi:hypothetical protein